MLVHGIFMSCPELDLYEPDQHRTHRTTKHQQIVSGETSYSSETPQSCPVDLEAQVSNDNANGELVNSLTVECEEGTKQAYVD